MIAIAFPRNALAVVITLGQPTPATGIGGGGISPPTFSPPPLQPASPDPDATAALRVTLPSGSSIFSDPSAIGTDNTYAAFDTVFDHLTAALTGQDDTLNTARSVAALTVAANNPQLAQMNDASLAFPAALKRYGAWFRGIGSFQSAQSEGAAPGYRGRSGGFLAGIDRGVAPDLTLGIAAGYSHSDLSQSDGTSGTIETPRIIAYGLYRLDALALEATLGFAYDRIGTARPVASTGTNATQGHNGFEKNAALQAAFPLAVGDIAVVPHAGIHYVRLDENKFAESGAGSFDLAGGSLTTQSLQPSLGASVLTSIAAADGVTLIPAINASYARELLDTSRNLVLTSPASGTINALGISAAHDTVIVGPAVTARLGDMIELTGDYTLTLGIGKSTGQTVMAGARAAF